MTDAWNHLDDFDELGRPELRWGAGFVLVAALFAGGTWLAIHWTPRIALPPAPPPAAVMIDLAPLPAAPPTPQTETPPGPKQTLSQPKPELAAQPKVTSTTPPVPTPTPPSPLPSTPPVPTPDVAIPLPPPPPPRPPVEHHQRLRVHRPPPPHPDRTPPKQATTAPPQVQAPPAPTATNTNAPETPAPSSNAVPTWQSLLLQRLEEFKRYPPLAQEDDEQGVAYLRFTMDRNGKVLSASIAKSSGYDDLDQEALALIRRAQPLPKPPPEVPGDTITLTVPVRFYLQQ